MLIIRKALTLLHRLPSRLLTSKSSTSPLSEASQRRSRKAIIEKFKRAQQSILLFFNSALKKHLGTTGEEAVKKSPTPSRQVANILQICRDNVQLLIKDSERMYPKKGKKGSSGKNGNIEDFRKFSKATKEIIEWNFLNLEKYITKSDFIGESA